MQYYFLLMIIGTILILVPCVDMLKYGYARPSKIIKRSTEHLTLKTVCDEQDRECGIACRTKNNILVEECYVKCQENSPIC
jgi:hypothetical protein